MKTALITGANRGLGYAVAEALLSQDINVILTGRDSRKVKSAVDNLQQISSKASVDGFLCDVSNAESVQLLKTQLESKYEQLEILINNAGIIINNNAFPETTESELAKTLETNLFGPFRLTKRLLPLLTKASNPLVINVSSGMGSHAESSPGYTAYRLSKYALNGLTDIMHQELVNSNIKVVSVCPGWVHTELGGAEAPRTPAQGASSILAPVFEELESGAFYRDGKRLAW